MRSKFDKPTKEKSEATAALKIVDMAVADGKFPARKLADFLMVLSGLYLIVFHSHNENHHTTEAWVLLTIGGTDLGIQSIAKLAKAYLLPKS